MSDPSPPSAGPGPSAAAFKRHPERAYTGPTTHGTLGPRAGASAGEAERYFAQLAEAHEPPMPRMARVLGIGSWVLGGGESFEPERSEVREGAGCVDQRERGEVGCGEGGGMRGGKFGGGERRGGERLGRGGGRGRRGRMELGERLERGREGGSWKTIWRERGCRRKAQRRDGK